MICFVSEIEFPCASLVGCLEISGHARYSYMELQSTNRLNQIDSHRLRMNEVRATTEKSISWAERVCASIAVIAPRQSRISYDEIHWNTCQLNTAVQMCRYKYSSLSLLLLLFCTFVSLKIADNTSYVWRANEHRTTIDVFRTQRNSLSSIICWAALVLSEKTYCVRVHLTWSGDLHIHRQTRGKWICQKRNILHENNNDNGVQWREKWRKIRENISHTKD